MQPPEVFICVEVKPLSVFLPLLSLYEGMELMMACRYFSCSRLVESAWEGTAGKENMRRHFMIQVNNDPEFIELWAVKVISICYLFSLLIS